MKTTRTKGPTPIVPADFHSRRLCLCSAITGRKADEQAEERKDGVARDGTRAAQPCVRDGRVRMPPPAPFLPVPEQADAEQEREIKFPSARVSDRTLYSQEWISGLYGPCWANNKFKTGRNFEAGIAVYRAWPVETNFAEIRKFHAEILNHEIHSSCYAPRYTPCLEKPKRPTICNGLSSR